MCMHFKVLIFYLGKKKCKSWGFGRQNGDVEEIGENQALQKYKCLVVRGQNTSFFERPAFSLANPD